MTGVGGCHLSEQCTESVPYFSKKAFILGNKACGGIRNVISTCACKGMFHSVVGLSVHVDYSVW